MTPCPDSYKNTGYYLHQSREWTFDIPMSFQHLNHSFIKWATLILGTESTSNSLSKPPLQLCHKVYQSDSPTLDPESKSGCEETDHSESILVMGFGSYSGSHLQDQFCSMFWGTDSLWSWLTRLLGDTMSYWIFLSNFFLSELARVAVFVSNKTFNWFLSKQPWGKLF